MDIDCENRCGDRKKKGVNLMTGAELIKWIQDNHVEKADVYVYNQEGHKVFADGSYIEYSTIVSFVDGSDTELKKIVITD